ncbi:ATP-dependent RNA helicase HrpB [Mariniblastus fucicola]|uniref:ATP-dependent RNA helicase HrpB n=2 Tax=Mariniblastus fucicola TaxID=980251 RepID=A0A5B9P860_9BACT|nr:ATP-dependent RNA helicase HrpB [Mariniblastus fucicola]
MLTDEHWLRSNFRRLKNQPESGNAGDLAKLENFLKRFAASKERFSKRESLLPKPQLDETLPIAARSEEITEAILNHQVVVISGETGSGKSTQLPLIALQAGLGIRGMIGHTQPRRIAARGVAARLASQIGTPLGKDVGFKIRFDDKTGNDTFIKLMTDGILLAETQSDRFLNQYEMIIIDEAHERSLNIDFLLGGLKRILATRKDLKLIITSATINTQRFADHFTVDKDKPVPIINVEGRTYPVEIRYQPPTSPDGGDSQIEVSDHVAQTCRELVREEDGDILVFLPTEAEIRTVSRKLKAVLGGSRIEVLPLYARLSTGQQNEIFQPKSARRIVLATNVAESSITVPRISCVVDTGTARISHYAAKSKVQRLPIEPVSQASANQRSGRCGRIGPGVAVRLYAEDDYESRQKFTTPEIRRTNLASVILQTLHLRLGDIEEFPFIDPPRVENVRDGFKTLFEVGAVDEKKHLTREGRKLARLPVDPRIGKMIFSADREGCLAEVLVIASALEIQSPKLRPVERKQAADQAHEQFANEKSDFLGLLNIWDWYHERKEDLSKSKLKKACEQNFISFSLMRQWQEIYRQLKSMVGREGLKIRDRKNDYNAIHRSLMCGLLSGVAMLGDKHEFTGSGGIKFHLWPGSDVFGTKPKWIIAAEIVETTKRYGRTVASISPDWIERLAPHLIKKRHTDARWSKKKQSVMVSEHVSLFGLPIVAGRAVHYGPIDAAAARTIFIDRGLCGDEFEGTPDFYIHNQWLVEELEKEAAKTRDRDLVIDPFVTPAFYEQHLPEDVFDNRSLLQKLKSDPSLDQKLRMTKSDLLPGADLGNSQELFPNEVQIGSMEIPIEYKFSPGDKNDGATIRLPVEGIGQLDDVQTGWLIPGLMKSRVIELIRSLPKATRRMVVPAPETADTVVAEIEFGKGKFTEAVARELSKVAGQPISPSEFKLEKLSPHLKVNVEVVDEQGEVVAEGRSVAELRQQLGAEHSSSIVEVEDETWTQDGLKEWTWGDLPVEVPIQRGATRLTAFPAIIDQQDSVGLRLTDSKESAESKTRGGLIRLFRMLNRKAVKSQVNWLPEFDHHALLLSRFVPTKSLRDELGDLIVRIAFVEREKIPRTESDFQALSAESVERISIATQAVAKWLPKFSAAAHATDLALGNIPASRGTTKHDIKNQLSSLTTESFLGTTAWMWLKEYPRYFEGIARRIEKITSFPAEKDRELADEIEHFWTRYIELKEQHEAIGIVDPELIQFRWMIEEYRVSLFAQNLGTVIKVSSKRLDKQLDKVRRV